MTKRSNRTRGTRRDRMGYDLKAKAAGEMVSGAEEETWETQPRLEVPTLGTEERIHSFTEIELGFSEEQAGREARRCLRCDLET